MCGKLERLRPPLSSTRTHLGSSAPDVSRRPLLPLHHRFPLAPSCAVAASPTRPGHCYCYDGYYGIDCSNSSCPGTYCAYDNTIHLQHCQHCCSATYVHTDADVFVENQRKVPCDATHKGLSHGICDGFAQCQCAPPFLTDDCSVKDCPSNCSGRGVCSVEYPVSRCMCDPPATGDSCQLSICPNNCSWPNGDCNLTSGECACAAIKSPYNRTVFFDNYSGPDCSYVRPFAGAQARGAGAGAAAAAAAAVAAASLLLLLIAPLD